METSNKFPEDTLAHMRNLPKIYVEELELDRDIFLSVMGHICDLAQDEGGNSCVPTYMPLQYDVVQKYCSQGFPTKYVYSHYSQYCQTINAAILVYYKAIRSGKTKFSRDEYEKVFGKFFVSEQALAELDEQAIIDCFEPSMQSRIKLEKLDGHLFKTFIENWTKKRGQLLDAQIKCGQIIRDHFMPVEKFEELTAKGAKLKQALAFLDKLETESHDKCADSNDVVIPYAEYHALHELLLEPPEKRPAYGKNTPKYQSK